MLAASEAMLSRLNDESRSLDIRINDKSLNQVSEHPYLGIYLDSSLKWNKQILEMCSNVSRKLALLGRLRKILNRDMLNMLYLSMIQPRLDYGISVWGYCSNTNWALIVRLQHRAARIVTGNMDYINTRGESLVKELGWQSIEKRRDYFTAVLMYRCINEIAPRRLIDEA